MATEEIKINLNDIARFKVNSIDPAWSKINALNILNIYDKNTNEIIAPLWEIMCLLGPFFSHGAASLPIKTTGYLAIEVTKKNAPTETVASETGEEAS